MVHRLIVFCARCASCALDVSVGNICARFAQDSLQMRNIYAQDLCKIVLISPMYNICARFAQDCTLFPNAQYMRKICARLYLFLQCTIYAQDLHKIVLLSPMHNICTGFVQDCTSLPNVQRLQALLEEICHISHICSKFIMVFTS